MDMRELKALEIAARYKIAFEDGVWLVPSQSSPGTKYRVTIKPPSCPCEDFQLRQEACKHVIAARLVQERDYDGKAPVIDTDAVPKRPTYSQNWAAYNLAQRTEKHRFQVLLADLCAGLEEPARDGTGRKPTPLSDKVFAVAFKVYSTVSSRRFNCDLQDAVERGYLTRPLHCNRVNSILEDESLTPVLTALIARSALPLKAVETDFAVDSSGFSTSKFVRWFDEKYGVHRSGHAWVKVHLACGVKTNIITAAAIYGQDANDCPILPELVKGTAETFTVKEVSADKGYLSAENVEAIVAAGGTPFIAPKSSTTGGIGGLFERMFHFYQYRRPEFLAHYHKRSNVESTFSAIKRKFGDHVRSRTPAAMVNEALAKLLCHNIVTVIHSHCELGIEPVFWQNDDAGKDETPAVLPLVRPG
jgi:transposase